MLKTILENGDAVLGYRQDDFISYLISTLTEEDGLRYSHVGFYVDGKIIEANWKGVVLTKVNSFLKRYDDVLIMRPKKNIIDVEEFCDDLDFFVGRKYSYFQIFLNLISLMCYKIFKFKLRKYMKWDVDNKVICSELGGKALEEQSLQLKEGVKSQNLYPIDYVKSKLFSFFYRWVKIWE